MIFWEVACGCEESIHACQQKNFPKEAFLDVICTINLSIALTIYKDILFIISKSV